jgi:hypothetical protein
MFDTSNSKLKLMSNIELDFFRSQEGLLFDARRSAKFQNGGADRDRTGGLLVANQALSQLSYSPNELSTISYQPSVKPVRVLLTADS